MRWTSLLAALGGVALHAAPVDFPGKAGPSNGKKIVLISGDEEYRSEEALPQLARILSTRQGFHCTVLFAVDPKDGTVNPEIRNNIPGLEALKTADLMILFLRFRDLPDDQMRHIADYVAAGKPILGLRTSTHAFAPESPTYKPWHWKDLSGGFGRKFLGETWVAHHGAHGKQSTRGIIADGKTDHLILRGIRDGQIWGPTDVYTAKPLPDSDVLLLGQVLIGMDEHDAPLEGPKNNPMMPIAWTRSYASDSGKRGRVFTTTMGSSQDLQNEGFRRLVVNATFWTLGMDEQITTKANIDLVREYHPSPFKFGGQQRGLRPEQF